MSGEHRSGSPTHSTTRWRRRSRRWGCGRAADADATTTAAATPRFAAPVYVDQQLAGGEPEVFADVLHGRLIYTSHEGTTHLYLHPPERRPAADRLGHLLVAALACGGARRAPLRSLCRVALMLRRRRCRPRRTAPGQLEPQRGTRRLLDQVRTRRYAFVGAVSSTSAGSPRRSS